MTGQISFPSREELMARLTDELMSDGLAPGTKLPSERRLSERYGLSRPIVREVLRALQERGLVEIIPGRGVFARGVDTFDAARLVDVLYRGSRTTPRHLVEARAMLEVRAASLAAERATDDDIAAIERALRGIDRATRVVEKAESDIAFHALVARASHNPVIEIMFGSIAGLVFELMLRSLDDPAVVEKGAPYHHTVLAGIKNRDPEAAGAAMSDHLMLANSTFGGDLDESLDLIARRKVDDLVGRGTPVESVIGSVLDRFARDTLEPLIGEQPSGPAPS